MIHVAYCRFCKYWKQDDYYDDWAAVKVATTKEYGLCSGVEKPDDKPMMVAICDGEGILGQLVTHKTHSCAMYEYYQPETTITTTP